MANTKHFGALAAAAGALVAVGLVVLMLVVVEAGPAEATFPGQNGKIAYSSYDGPPGLPDWEIYTINPSGGEKFQVTNNTTDDFEPSYSPDGKKIAYSGWDGGIDSEIITIGPCGGGKSSVTHNFTPNESPSYSPNGQRIAYKSWEGPPYEIYTINTGGGSEVQLTDNTTLYENSPDYSPDGQKIAYQGRLEGPHNGEEIYTINPSGGGKVQVTNNTGPALMPSYSPDGQKIAYSAYDGHDYEIYTINADGGGGAKVRVTNNTRDDFEPSYSPDGKKIAYAHQDAPFPNGDDGDFEIYTINAGGGVPSFLGWLFGLPQKGTVRLTNNTKYDRDPSWGKLPEVVKPCEALP